MNATPKNTAQESPWEPPEEVVIPYALAHSPNLQAEDYGVLIRLLVRDPTRPSSMKDLVEDLQASGWKMGETRLAAVMKRLQAAGHVRHRAGYNPATRRPEWTLTVDLDSLAHASPVAPQTRRQSTVNARGCAYAIREVGSERVKIGHSENPMARLRSLRTGSALPLELIWMAEGGAALEAFLHRCFRDRHMRGEWFDFTGSQASVLIQQAAAEFGGGK